MVMAIAGVALTKSGLQSFHVDPSEFASSSEDRHEFARLTGRSIADESTWFHSARFFFFNKQHVGLIPPMIASVVSLGSQTGSVAGVGRWRRFTVAGVSALATIVWVVGCGDDGFGTRYKVSGTVTYKGQPIEKGTINFYPVNPEQGRGAFGTITNGSYTLTTSGAGNDGIAPGKYKVAVDDRLVDESKTSGFSGGSAKQDDVAKAIAQAKGRIPTKYNLPETSGLTATIDGPKSDLNFDLVD